MSAEHPIIYSSDMVRAYLEGRKTMTRRTQGLEKINTTSNLHNWVCKGAVSHTHLWRFENDAGDFIVIIKCPYGQVGDVLWGRESFAMRTDGVDQILYKADYEALVKILDLPEINIKWKPSIHMFRKDSRITQPIAEIRVERLQNITSDDIIAEGEPYMPLPPEGLLNFGYTKPYKYTKEHFAYYWDSINAKRGYSWESNPWAWCISYPKYSEEPTRGK